MKCPKCHGTGEVTDPRKVGSDMRTLREKAGISLRALADRMQFSAAYISDLELGRRAWSEKLLTKYREAIVGLPKHERKFFK